MIEPEIMTYYEHGGEHHRLATGAGRLEFLRTWDVLGRVLPGPPGRILDVGGATGVYAAPLARAGYDVLVIDPVPDHVAAAGACDGVAATLGDARSLPVPDGGADAVLLLGPLYHLPERGDRVTAWREAARAARTGGVVIGAGISRFASMLDGFGKGFFAEPGYRPLVEGALRDGAHRNVADRERWFTSAYFHRPEEAAAEAGEAGLREVRTVAVEGPVWLTGPRVDEFLDDPRLAELTLDMLRRVEAEPSLLGASSHLLTIGRTA
ncbi:class I SAM-dependent methyltransferase [Mangrovihabitans endophyticus]|uniref:Methyltransferase type 11 domain-containing protein n=1 Tax=Mangrovihabitans endophyticus TaxID=1751298 RepID=A0A8J3FQJ8_9ACTN|nr:class I SAM-dependent methyltransferase [Mangrovihabitans endophyticus]GGL03889.1 hypothetical protein GCM10012284_43100 [Mangrovihabitans endophyticus]